MRSPRELMRCRLRCLMTACVLLMTTHVLVATDNLMHLQDADYWW